MAPTHLTRLLRSGEGKAAAHQKRRPAAVPPGLQRIRRPVLPIKNKSLDNGLNDILFPASAATSVNRVLEHLGYPVPRKRQWR